MLDVRERAARVRADMIAREVRINAMDGMSPRLAEMAAKLQVGWAHLDWAVKRHLAGALTANEAAASKLWHTEAQWEILDGALQLHGGAGYMNEYPIAKLWRDGRVRRIYGGSSEIMMEMVGRGL